MIDLADQNDPVNIERAQKLLGWNLKHDLRSTLIEIVARLHDDPRKWYKTNGLPVPDGLTEEHQESRT